MDIANLCAPSIAVLDVTHHLIDDLGIQIHGYTPDSKEYKQLRKKHAKKDKQNLYIEKGKQRMELDPSDIDLGRKLLIGSIIKVTSREPITSDGKPIDLSTPEACQKFFETGKGDWMLEQWDEFTDERGNYWKTLAKPLNYGQDALDGSTPTPNE